MPSVEQEIEEGEKLCQKSKDPEKSFSIDLARLISKYLSDIASGKTPNFSEAGLLIQNAGYIYGKKVEYLCSLVWKLHENICKARGQQDTAEDATPSTSGGVKKVNEERKRVHKEKENKLDDPFFSVEIKPGKNLSCLRVKKVVNPKKGTKKAAQSVGPVTQRQDFVPIDLLPLENEEKGEVIYDVRGNKIGYQGDFMLNKCRITSSGWLLLPTVSPDTIEIVDEVSDQEDEEEEEDYHDPGSDPIDDLCEPPQGTQTPEVNDDEGYPPSSGCPSSQNSDKDQVPSSQQSDEGIGGSIPCTPNEDEDPLGGSEPMDDDDRASTADTVENAPDSNSTKVENKELRKSMRRSQMLSKPEVQDENQDPEENCEELEERPVKKAISKKNILNLPLKLKNSKPQELLSAAAYCSQTFFSVNYKASRHGVISLGISAFSVNSKMLERLNEQNEFMKNYNKNRKKSKDSAEDDDDLASLCDSLGTDANLDDVASTTEGGDVANMDDVMPPNLLEDQDIVFPVMPLEQPETDPSADVSRNEDDAVDETFQAVDQQDAAFHGHLDDAGLSEKIFEWQQMLQPKLESIAEHKKFDIYDYGQQIIGSFPDGNSKTSVSFKDICKGKQKWEIHRFFMSLLPLVNVGNVSIETELSTSQSDQGKEAEDIYVTLLSRKLHHEDLEKFGDCSPTTQKKPPKRSLEKDFDVPRKKK